MSHPYSDLDAKSFWRPSIAEVEPTAVDPVTTDLRIDPDTRIATAGSCFAQHIARYLRSSGFHFMNAETPPTVLSRRAADAGQYGTYSARYGNIYTARQLLQLFRRAHGTFAPAEDCWEGTDGSVIDPFRPQIQPGGFASKREFELDREQHFAAVRRMFSHLDVFVFTLGLTETWEAVADGAIFPMCPGTAGGVFDPQRHRFVNLTVDDVTNDLTTFFGELRQVNPKAQLLLTVSPVPLVATASGQHVLTATTYSKSVLRVAAETAAAETGIHYFPSYEIVTNAANRGSYFAPDLRQVTEAGVSHVMGLFFRHLAGHVVEPVVEPAAPTTTQTDLQSTGSPSVVGPNTAVEAGIDIDLTVEHDQDESDIDETMQVICDLETLDPGPSVNAL